MFFRPKRKNRYLLLLISIVLVALILITIAYKFSIDQYRFSYPISYFFSSLSSFFHGLYNNIANYVSMIMEYKRIKIENQKLKKTISILLNENNNLKEKVSYYERWNKMEKYKETSSFKLISANVVGREPSNWFKYIFIDKGSKDGLKKDMVVITYLGLVGKIKAVTKKNCKSYAYLR